MDLEKTVRECLGCFRGRVRHCALHSFRHLEKAEEIKEIDPEMAAFRAITAEEEAATALFFSLRERQYDGAKKIQHRSHLYKLGLNRFLWEVMGFLSSMEDQHPPRRLRRTETDSGDPRLIWEVEAIEGRWAQPVPPLHLMISDSKGRPYHFEREIEALKAESKQRDLKKYLESIANQRNELLYASDQGRPGIASGLPEMLAEQRKRVVRICALVCMIQPYSEKALFVQQCLNAFLFMIEKIDDKALARFDYDVDLPRLREGSEAP
jgi:hypothetical protein